MVHAHPPSRGASQSILVPRREASKPATLPEAPSESKGPGASSDAVALNGLSGLPANLDGLAEVPAQFPQFHILDPALGTIACHDVSALQARCNRLEAQGTRLWAIRHGESEANAKSQGASMSGQTETPLTAKGRAQAEATATQILKDLGGQAFLEELAKDPSKMPVVYASPLSRAFDTAKALQDRIPGLTIAVDPDLIELDFGLCDGLNSVDVANVYRNFGKGVDFTHRFPEGECGFDVMARMDRFLNKVEERHPRQTVLYFAHTMTVGIGKMLLGGATHNDKGQLYIDRHSIPNAAPFVLTNPPQAPAPGRSPEEFLLAG